MRNEAADHSYEWSRFSSAKVIVFRFKLNVENCDE